MNTFENTHDKNNIKPIIHYCNEEMKYLRNLDILCNIMSYLRRNLIAVFPV